MDTWYKLYCLLIRSRDDSSVALQSVHLKWRMGKFYSVDEVLRMYFSECGQTFLCLFFLTIILFKCCTLPDLQQWQKTIAGRSSSDTAMAQETTMGKTKTDTRWIRACVCQCMALFFLSGGCGTGGITQLPVEQINGLILDIILLLWKVWRPGNQTGERSWLLHNTHTLTQNSTHTRILYSTKALGG